MASRATRQWRSMLTRLEHNRTFASSTTPKFAPNVESAHHYNRYAMMGEFAPVYMVMGMVVVAISIAVHTAKQQLRHSPGVYLIKKKRESMPEVDTPDVIRDSGSKFINKSFLRKVGHIQHDKRPLPDPRPDTFTRTLEKTR